MRRCVLTLFLLLASADDFFSTDSGVVTLTADTFAKKTAKDIWWVLFYSPNNAASKNIKPEFTGFAADVSGLVNVGSVDCKAFPSVCATETEKKFPVIKTYTNGTGQVYEGSKTMKLMSERAQKDIPSIEVTHQTAAGHSAWLEENHLPRALYFHDKKKDIPVLWKAMSVQFQGRMAFGVVSKSDRKLTRRYGIKEFPAIVVVPYVSDDIKDSKVDEEEEDDEDEGESNAIGYPGVMTPLAVRDWLTKYATADESLDAEPLGIEELSDTSCLKAICVDATGLCAIVIVNLDPVKVDKRKLREEVQVWVQTRDLRQDSFYNFAWIDGMKQADFISKSFGLTPQDYPQVVVLAGRKPRYATFVGAYDPAAVNEWLNQVQKTKVPTLPMSGVSALPALEGDTTRCKGMKINNKETKKGASKIAEKPVADDEDDDDAELTEEDLKMPTTVKRVPRGHRGKSAIKLTAENFEKLVLNSRQPWMIMFADTKSDQEAIEQFNQATKHFAQTIKLAVVDTSVKENQQFAEDHYSITEYPAIRIFKHGKKNDDTIPTHYEGDFTKEALIAKGSDLLQAGEMLCPAVTGPNFENWVGNAPFFPRLILFSDKEAVPSMMKAFALEFFTEEVLVGVVLNQSDLAERYEVKKYPTMVYLQGNPSALETGGGGMSKLGFNVKHLDLPKKLDYSLLQQVGDELADMWAMQRSRVMKKLDEIKREAEKQQTASNKRSKPPAKSATRATTKQKPSKKKEL